MASKLPTSSLGPYQSFLLLEGDAQGEVHTFLTDYRSAMAVGFPTVVQEGQGTGEPHPAWCGPFQVSVQLFSTISRFMSHGTAAGQERAENTRSWTSNFFFPFVCLVRLSPGKVVHTQSTHRLLTWPCPEGPFPAGIHIQKTPIWSTPIYTVAL